MTVAVIWVPSGTDWCGGGTPVGGCRVIETGTMTCPPPGTVCSTSSPGAGMAADVLLTALGQLKKAEKRCDLAKDANATFKQIFTQLEAENACKNRNLDNAIGEAGNARIKDQS
nr:unnamed protein product [Callosobruchus chinensis]